jgi:hypothetical protein
VVEVQIRRPIPNEESQAIDWEVLAVVTADGSRVEIDGDASYVLRDMIVSVYTGQRVDPGSDAEGWARNLPFAYRSGDLVAVIRRDDDAPEHEVPSPEASVDEPAVPEPPIPEFDEAEGAEQEETAATV